MELPRYTCHKVVQAAKVLTIGIVTPEGTEMTLETPGGEVVHKVSAEWIVKHDPQPGGYFVRYEDGYESWSPADAFERGYTLE